VRRHLRAAIDLALWPCLLPGAAVRSAVDGGRTLRWVRGADTNDSEPDPI
jgi:hypothetical protein